MVNENTVLSVGMRPSFVPGEPLSCQTGLYRRGMLKKLSAQG